MLKKTAIIFILFICITQNVFAQLDGCADKFDEIDPSCILKYKESMKDLRFVIVKEGKTYRADNTIFFQTSNGHLGKFIIKSAYASKTECSLYLDAVTYIDGQLYYPNANFSIKNEFNSWGTHQVGFDELGIDDFALIRTKGKCVFTNISAKAKLYKKTNETQIIESNDVLFYASLFLIGLSVFLVARTIFQDEDRFKAEEKLEDVDNTEKDNTPNDIVLKYSRPFFKRYFSPVVAGMKNKKQIREKYKRVLSSSGMNKFLTPEDFFAFKLFLILGFPILYLGIGEFLEEDWPLVLVPVMSAIGFVYPDIWIKGKIEIRQKEVLRNMPFAVDMLALCVEAGLDFVAAMAKVIEKAPPSALSDEFEIMLKETKIGATRAEGLRQMAWRINALEMSSFCATLIAADSVGANISPILKTLSIELRQKTSTEVEKMGAKAATKMLLPMMMFILPSVLVIIMAPLALELMGAK